MHPYASDSDERTYIPFFLAGFSIGAALLLSMGLTYARLDPPWWLEAPSVLGFYSLFHKVFDRWLWRTRIMRALRITHVPDLSGNWEGSVTSSYDHHATQVPVTVRIDQTWSRFSLRLRTEQSRSHTTVTAYFIHGPDGATLSYQYVNEPIASAKETMHIHHGAGRLVLSSDRNELSGDYYSSRGRQNVGTMRLTRRSRRCSDPRRTTWLSSS